MDVAFLTWENVNKKARTKSQNCEGTCKFYNAFQVDNFFKIFFNFLTKISHSYKYSRQDLPHQGFGYVKSNIRHFVYIDLKGLKRTEGGTTAFEMPKNKFLSENQIIKAEANLNGSLTRD